MRAPEVDGPEVDVPRVRVDRCSTRQYLCYEIHDDEENMTTPAPVPDSDALKLWVVLSRAHAAVEVHARADFARRGLSPGEFGALEVLHHKGALLLGELQRKILVSSGGTTWVIDRLVEKGLVQRRPCPTDRRASFVELTPEGTALMEAIFPLHQQVIERAMSALSEGEMRTLIQVLKRLGHGAAALEPEPASDHNLSTP
jgi:MarR family transcriptional regulator, 2-MHQ and catechol-resistance regulon repressor